MVKLPVVVTSLFLASAIAAQSQRRITASVSPEVLHFEPMVDAQRVKITVAVVSLAAFSLAIAVPPLGEVADTIEGFRDHYGAVVVLSGGFLASFHPAVPLGMVKVNGAVLNRFVKTNEVLTGILALNDGRPVIRNAQAFSDATWADCLQSGPVIVAAGQATVPTPPRTKAEAGLIDAQAARVAIATVADDRVLLVYAEPVGLRGFAAFLAAKESAGGLSVIDALNLSGAATAGLLVNTPRGDVVAGSKYSQLPNAIIVRPRLTASRAVIRRR